MLNAVGVTVRFGKRTLFEDVNIKFNKGCCYGIIGANGAGKSTFLKVLSGELEPSKGEVTMEKGERLSVLKQDHFAYEEHTVIDTVIMGNQELYKIMQDKNEIYAKPDFSEEDGMVAAKLEERFAELDGWNAESDSATLLNNLGIPGSEHYKLMREIEAKDKVKVLLAQSLFGNPDILLLDEPTNHLDIETIEWLEQYLKNYSKSVVIVSHDRMFLNKIVNKVYEIEYGVTTAYSGNYTFFEEQKKINYEKQLKDYEYQQKEIKRLNDIVTRFKYKPTKAKMAMSKLKQIERMVKIEAPNKYDLTTFKTNFIIEKQSGKDVLFAKDLEIGYDKTLQKISLNVYRGQKIGIIGENGIGKSTLLKTLVGIIPKISGEFEFGHNVQIGYFDQQMALLDSEKTVLEDFSEEFPNLTTTELRNSLAAFMFYGEDVFKKINMLSGGEKVRLQLCKILKKGPNLLILDEPTNHMDIIGKESLELLLKEYTGTIIFVSHDRFFVNKIADTLLIFTKHQVKQFKRNLRTIRINKSRNRI